MHARVNGDPADNIIHAHARASPDSVTAADDLLARRVHAH